MEIKFKIWFEYEKRYFFGRGLYELFQKIELTGSILDASKSLKMSYRNAWGKIVKAEKVYGRKLVLRNKGRKVQKSILTDEARYLMSEYRKYEDVFNHYLRRPYIIPSVAVDGILVRDNKVLLVKRKNDPYVGYYALPGGFVEYNETTENAIIREMKEETNLDVKINGIVGVYSDPSRDPRGHVISIVYELDTDDLNFRAGDDAERAEMVDLKSIPPLAFDHSKIIKDFMIRKNIE